MVDHVEENREASKKKSKKPIESGIIYLSSIPTLMNVTILRRYFEVFGEVGRIFLQPNGKKKNKWREELWNIKYLHRFKWAHLNERLAYEKAVHSQRMRAEISQAKREANFYVQNAEKNERLKKLAKRKLKGDKNEKVQESGIDQDSSFAESERIYKVRLKETDEEIMKKKRLKEAKDSKKTRRKNLNSEEMQGDELSKQKSFLTKIFSAGAGADSEQEDD
ncbi:activator of basal transcription 1-like isoform X2 [Dreissena polymorpha]|uniref:activator of basal transcription 1-like isoform X2 n=1 Tax=Dreissena polymorpha TaxID=45954 RepID=UPI002264C990|nr:activator of basal transcription 1-like isoform X2 [Dreissena polymorpha]